MSSRVQIESLVRFQSNLTVSSMTQVPAPPHLLVAEQQTEENVGYTSTLSMQLEIMIVGGSESWGESASLSVHHIQCEERKEGVGGAALLPLFTGSS